MSFKDSAGALEEVPSVVECKIPKPLFTVGPTGPETKVAIDNAIATLDELPCTQSPEALCSVT